MFDRLTISARPSSPAELVKFMQSEIQRYGRIIQESGAEAD